MKPHRLSLILGVILVGLLGLGGVGYYYGQRYLKMETAKVSDELTQASQSQSQLDALAQAKASFTKNIVPLEGKIETALPKTKQQTEILAQLQRLAEANGLSLSAVTLPNPAGLPSATSQTSAVSGLRALPISFQLTGSYAQLQSFLTSLENLNRSTTVSSLIITKPDTARAVTYAITINAYIKP